MTTVLQSQRIKIMHVVDVLGLAGMEYGVIKLVNRMDPSLFSPMICCLRARSPKTVSLLDEQIPVFELRKHPGRDFGVIFKLASLFQREQVEIAHSHNWPTFFFTVMAAAIARVPIVIHGEHGRESQSLRRRQQVVSRWLAGTATHLVTVSTNLNRELIENWRIRPEEISAIPNGVDKDTFGQEYDLSKLREEFGLGPESRVVLNVGRTRPVKDQPTLLRGFGRLFKKLPDVRLILVGASRPGERQNLEKLADGLGVKGAVHFSGIRDDIPQLLTLCDVYVNSSLFEGMSNTILEAMAAGRPVVATNVGGNPELVRDAVTGFLIPPGDDQALAERLEELLMDGDLRKKFGAAGRLRIEQEHSMSAMVRSYSEMYQEIFSRYQLKKSRSMSLRGRAKQWLARTIKGIGLNRLKETSASPKLAILAYHRVLPLHESLQYPFQGMVVPRDVFEAQIAHLARNYTVLTFPEALRLLQEGRIPRRAVVLTFDDGYRDNYEHAFPILKKYQLPATFFLVTGAVDGDVRLWWDEVAERIKRLSQQAFSPDEKHHRLPEWLFTLLRNSRKGNYSRLSEQIVSRLNGVSLAERRQSLKALCASVSLDSSYGSELMLTWDQARALRHAGMEIGSHTVTHAFLDEIDESRAQQEIAGSIQRIQEQLSSPVRFFAYPRGRGVGSFRKLFERAGIEAAVTGLPGRNTPATDLLQLKRVGAGFCRGERGFDPAIFDTELQGWFNRLRQS